MMPGFPEMAVVLVIVLIFFGAGKLPEVFGSMGEGVKRFKDAQRDVESAAEDVTPKLAEGASDVEEAHEVSTASKVES